FTLRRRPSRAKRCIVTVGRARAKTFLIFPCLRFPPETACGAHDPPPILQPASGEPTSVRGATMYTTAKPYSAWRTVPVLAALGAAILAWLGAATADPPPSP